MGECFNERTERSSIGELISVTMNSGVIKASDLDRKDNSSKDKSNYKKVEIGDIAYNSMRMWQGSSGESTFRGILSPAYTVLIPNKDISSTFFSYYFKLERMLEIFKVNSQGLTSDTWNLKYPTIAKIVVSVPTLKEQIQIGNFFKQLDDTIALHQRELEKFKILKTSYLENIFLGKVSLFTAKNTITWEQRKLGELATFSKGCGYSKSDLRDSGYPIILYGRLYTQYETEITEVDTFIENDINAIKSYGNEVIVPASGETSEEIARASAVGKKGIVIGGDLNIIRPKQGISTVFLALSISNGDLQKNLSKKAQGKSVVHIRNDDLKEVILKYPSYEEQTQIGNFFKQLDDTIALHQKELAKYQQIKTACLEKMFVE